MRALLALGLALAGAAGLQAYTITAPWRTPIVYYVNPANSYGFTPEAIERAVAEAVRPWTVANPDVSVTYGGRTTVRATSCTGPNVIYFDATTKTNLLAEATSCFEYRRDPETGAQYRYRKYDVDIALFERTGTGGRRPFIVDDRQCSPSGWYLQDVLTHEVGHLLGLSHVGARVPTMYRALGKCLQTWRTLEFDDFDGIKALYPTPPARYWRTHRPRRDGGDIGID